MHKVALDLGGFSIYWYGVLVAAGFLAGLWTAVRRAPRAGLAAERVMDLGTWILVGALVGARALYVLSYWREEFAGQPWYEPLMVRKGGLVFYGGFLGAALSCVVYCRWKKLPLWRVADVMAPSVALGYCLGRLGCLMNGCCFGRACDLPWAIHFPNGHETYPQGVHPTQVYEALSGLLLYALLAWLFRRRRFDGQIFALYLMLNGSVRFGVEFFRGDYAVRYLGGWATPAQLLCLLLIAAGALLWTWRSTTKSSRPSS